MGKYEIHKASNGQYYFNLKAGNQQTILTSEMYVKKESAQNGIQSVMKNGAQDSRYESKVSANGLFYFILKAGNNEPIGKSEMYTSEQARENGINSVKENSQTTVIEDLA
jgi:uncharacterized protein